MAFFPCRETYARLGNHTQAVLASSEWGTRQMAEALCHWISCPLLFLRTGLHCPQQPGMGNGVKEGVVRLREDADTVLPSSVPSKASTWPQVFSWVPLLWVCTHHRSSPTHTLVWGCISVRPWVGEMLAARFVCESSPQPLGKSQNLTQTFGWKVRSCPGAPFLSQICKHKRISKLWFFCEEGPSRPILALRARLRCLRASLKG